MAITFPLNPVNGVTHIENGITFEYDSTSGSWKKQISIGTLEANTSTFSVTSAVTEEFNRTLGSGVSTDLTLSNDHNDKALVHAKKFIPGDDVTDINWDFDTTDESQWNFLSDKIEFVDGKVRLKGVLNPGGDIVEMSGTYYLYLALMDDGTVWGIGSGVGIGIGTTETQDNWVKSNISDVVSISVGANSYAVTSNGELKVCGTGSQGSMGISNQGPHSNWTTSISSGVSKISSGGSFAMAIMNDGSVKVTGQNSSGVLGLNHTVNQGLWIDTIGLSDVSEIWCGHQSTAWAKMNNGSIKAVGSNGPGYLGTGDSSDKWSWTSVSGINNASKISGFSSAAVALVGTSVYTAGSNYQGHLGYNSGGQGNRLTFGYVLGGVNSVHSTDTGHLAIMSSGEIKKTGIGSGGNGSGEGLWYTLSGASSGFAGAKFSKDMAGGYATSPLILMSDGTIQKLSGSTIDSSSEVATGLYSGMDVTTFNEPNGTVDSISSISLVNTATINSLSITENKPTGTDIKYAISFDGKTTWRVPAGAITDISTEGVDATTLATYDFTGFTGTTLDIQSYLTTTDTSVSPDIDLITVGLSQNGTYTQVAIDGVTLLASESGTNTVTVTNGDATEETYNFMVSVDVPETITVDGIVGAAGAAGAAGADGTDGGALVHWTETANGNILPNTDNSHDIGSAEYKVRDLYVSDNSIWVGDQHKIEIDATGKMKIRKRKKDVVPASIATAGGDQAAALTHAGVGAVQDMKMHHWINYMRTIGNPNAGTHDVFDFNNTAEVEPDITLDSSDMYTKTEVDTIVSGSGGINTYPTMSNLPLTGVTAGSMAMVLDVNKLYVNNGQGWYFISLINTSPSITGGIDSNYTLDKTGLPTVITVIADDPEGVPLTYTHSSPTLGNTAVITQNNNVFTVTPSTLESDAGMFDLTISASDGINIASQTTNMLLLFEADASGVVFNSSRTWTVPSGVSSISLLAVGGGGHGGSSTAANCYGGGSGGSGGQGGGGGMGYYNNYSVLPGDILQVTVGGNGASSHISKNGVVIVQGNSGSGGGNASAYSGAYSGAGGGYTGDGGVTGVQSPYQQWQTSSVYASNNIQGYGLPSGNYGRGGYGAQKSNCSHTGGSGSQGVARIIWGDVSVTREFPSTNIEASDSVISETIL